MNATSIERIETIAERGASALFGAAVGYAALHALGGLALAPALYAYAVGAGAVACLLCNGALKRMAGERPQFAVPVFDLRELDAFGMDELLLTDTHKGELLLTERVDDELVLTDADRVEPVAPCSSDPLVLDDVLREIAADSRVVRLFDPKLMPTPGQLKSRIDNHLGQGSAAAAPADASQALSDALAELKRSLR